MTAPTLTDLGTSYGPTVVPGTCEWALEMDDWNAWRTGCDEMFILEEGGPVENKMAFCCYCGLKLVEVRPEAEDGDENDSGR